MTSFPITRYNHDVTLQDGTDQREVGPELELEQRDAAEQRTTSEIDEEGEKLAQDSCHHRRVFLHLLAPVRFHDHHTHQ